MMQRIAGNTTDGLASAYQVTQITGAGAATFDAAGNFIVPVTAMPYWRVLSPPRQLDQEQQSEAPEPPQDNLAAKMAQDAFFCQLTARGQAEVERGDYSRIQNVKQKLGDV